MTLRRRMGTQVTLALGGQVVNAASTLAMILLVARAVDPNQLGIYLIAISAVTALSLVTTFGAATGLVRMLARYRALGQTDHLGPAVIAALAPTIVASTLTGLALFYAAPFVARAYASGSTESQAQVYLAWFAAVVPLWAISTVLLCALRGLGAVFPFVACENVGRPILQVLLTAAVLAAGRGTEAVATAWSLPFVLEAAVVVPWFLTEWRRRVGHRIQWRDYEVTQRRVNREYWAFAYPQALAAIVQVLGQGLDIVLVGVLSTAAEAGIYGAGYRYVGGGGLILGAIVVGIGPRASELFALRDEPGSRQLYRKASAAGCFLGLAPYAVLALFASFAMGAFGASFTSGAATLAILASATCLNILAGPALVVLALSGATRTSGTITTASALLGLSVDLVLVPQYGAVGAAAGFATAVAIGNVWPLSLLWRRYRIHPFGPETRSILLAATVSLVPVGVIAHLTGTDKGRGALSWLAISALMYCGVLWSRRQPLVRMVRDSLGAETLAGDGTSA